MNIVRQFKVLAIFMLEVARETIPNMPSFLRQQYLIALPLFVLCLLVSYLTGATDFFGNRFIDYLQYFFAASVIITLPYGLLVCCKFGGGDRDFSGLFMVAIVYYFEIVFLVIFILISILKYMFF